MSLTILSTTHTYCNFSAPEKKLSILILICQLVLCCWPKMNPETVITMVGYLLGYHKSNLKYSEQQFTLQDNADLKDHKACSKMRQGDIDLRDTELHYQLTSARFNISHLLRIFIANTWPVSLSFTTATCKGKHPKVNSSSSTTGLIWHSDMSDIAHLIV